MKPILLALALLSLAGCAHAPYRTAGRSVAAVAAAAHPTVTKAVTPCGVDETAFDCDRRAILAMVGEYEVTFAFDETVVLGRDYVREAPQRSGGFETVVLVEDTGDRIALQHLLVGEGGHVTKHWRQDWVFELPVHWEYAGDQRFAPKTRDPASVAGTWTQLVYEVSDAPRYAGSGRWNHKYGVSTWTSDRTWRPLPRREYTKRQDYDILNAENRHTITPHGFTHEQDNTKVVQRDGRDATLVREFGFNDYRRIAAHDFEPAYAYWRATAPFWAELRARWTAVLADHAARLAYPTGDEALIKAVFGAAERFRKDRADATITPTLDDAFARFVDDSGTPIEAGVSAR